MSSEATSASLAQSAEPSAHNGRSPGSSPGGCTDTEGAAGVAGNRSRKPRGPQGQRFEPSAFRQCRHAQVPKRSKGARCKCVGLRIYAGSNPALSTNLRCAAAMVARRSLGEGGASHPVASYGRQANLADVIQRQNASAPSRSCGFESRRPLQLARKADLVTAPRRNRGEVGSKPTPGTSLRAEALRPAGQPVEGCPPKLGEGGSICGPNIRGTHKCAGMPCKQVRRGALPRCSTNFPLRRARRTRLPVKQS
jgi:hypothetical protein